MTRVRQVHERLNVSIVEAVCTGTRVRQSHVASLGSVLIPPSPADRFQFWIKVHRRLETLTNRLDDEARAAIMAAIALRRIPNLAQTSDSTRNFPRR